MNNSILLCDVNEIQIILNCLLFLWVWNWTCIGWRRLLLLKSPKLFAVLRSTLLWWCVAVWRATAAKTFYCSFLRLFLGVMNEASNVRMLGFKVKHQCFVKCSSLVWKACEANHRGIASKISCIEIMLNDQNKNRQKWWSRRGRKSERMKQNLLETWAVDDECKKVAKCQIQWLRLFSFFVRSKQQRICVQTTIVEAIIKKGIRSMPDLLVYFVSVALLFHAVHLFWQSVSTHM